MIELPVSLRVLLRHPQGNVLFDTGCHPSVPDDPAARWGGLAKIMTPIMPPGENVLTGLAGDRRHARRHRCRGLLASASRSLRLQRLLQARDRDRAREGDRGRARAGRRERSAISRPNGTSAPFDELERPARSVRRWAHRADPAARPHAGHRSARWSRSSTSGHVPARRRHREPARDARYAMSCRATPGMPTRW